MGGGQCRPRPWGCRSGNVKMPDRRGRYALARPPRLHLAAPGGARLDPGPPAPAQTARGQGFTSLFHSLAHPLTAKTRMEVERWEGSPEFMVTPELPSRAWPL